MFPREGIYLLSLDSLIREGLVLCNFGTDHPSMTSPEAMIPHAGIYCHPGGDGCHADSREAKARP